MPDAGCIDDRGILGIDQRIDGLGGINALALRPCFAEVIGIAHAARCAGIDDAVLALGEHRDGELAARCSGCKGCPCLAAVKRIECAAGVVAVAVCGSCPDVGILRADCNCRGAAHIRLILQTDLIDLFVDKAVIVADRGKVQTVRCRGEIERNNFLDAVRMEGEGREVVRILTPEVRADEHAVSGGDEHSVRIARVGHNSAGPVNRLIADPRIAAVLQIVGDQRLIPALGLAGGEVLPCLAAVERAEILVSPCRTVLLRPRLPFLILPLAAGARDHVIGIGRIRPDRAVAGGAVENLLDLAVLRGVAVAAAGTALECKTCHIADEQIAVRVNIDARGVDIRREVLAQRCELIGFDICNVDICNSRLCRCDIDLAAGHCDGGNAVLRLIGAVHCAARDVIRPCRPLGCLGEQSEIVIADDRFPCLAAVGGFDQRGFGIGIRGDVAARIDDLRVIRIDCDRLAELSAVAVAHDLDEIRDIDLLKGLAAVRCLEDDRFLRGEICAAAEEINGVVIGRVHRHCIHGEQTAVGIGDEAEELLPRLGIIVVAVCTADVGSCIHDLFSGHNTGDKAAAADAERAPCHVVGDILCCSSRRCLRKRNRSSEQSQCCQCGDCLPHGILFHNGNPFSK